MSDQRFSVQQVATMCSVSETTVKKWNRENTLRFKRVPDSNRMYVEARTLYQFMAVHGLPIPDTLKGFEIMAEPEKELVTQEVSGDAITDGKELVTQEVTDEVTDEVCCDNEECEDNDCDHHEWY